MKVPDDERDDCFTCLYLSSVNFPVVSCKSSFPGLRRQFRRQRRREEKYEKEKGENQFRLCPEMETALLQSDFTVPTFSVVAITYQSSDCLIKAPALNHKLSTNTAPGTSVQFEEAFAGVFVDLSALTCAISVFFRCHLAKTTACHLPPKSGEALIRCCAE